MLEFKNVKPEKHGIPSEAVRQFEERLARLGVRMHGYLLLCGKDIVGEKYHAPYGPDTRHRMYSITKSFTSMAVGLLLKEGRIALDDRICSYFPEKISKEGPYPWCGEMTIRDMLTMRTCYASTTYKRYESDDWVESFFRVKPDHVPGTVFSYDTSSSHVLAALVEKLTGMDMLDFLRKEALGRLGFSTEAYILKDPQGVSQGGSGLLCTLRDVAKAAWLCSHYGILDGEEVLPSDFMRQATADQVPTDLQPVVDEQGGYGYMFWMPRQESSRMASARRRDERLGHDFTMYGMGGQLALCFPELDFCLVTMADTIGNPAGLQMIYDSFYDILFPYLCAGRDEAEERTAAERGARLPGREPLSVPGKPVPGEGKLFRKGVERYLFYENSMGWKGLEFDWDRRQLRLEHPDGIYELHFGMEEWCRQSFPGTDYRSECRGMWKNSHFLLHCFVTDEEQGHVSMDFTWKDDRLGVRMVSTGEAFWQHFKGTASAGRDS